MEKRFKEVLRLLLTPSQTYLNGKQIVDLFISRRNIFLRVSMSLKEEELRKRPNNLLPCNCRSSWSGSCCQLLPKMEKSTALSLTSRSCRRHWNSQKRHLIRITWNSLLYPFGNVCLGGWGLLRSKDPILFVEPLVFCVFFQKLGLLFQAMKLKYFTRKLVLENLGLKSPQAVVVIEVLLKKVQDCY